MPEGTPSSPDTSTRQTVSLKDLALARLREFRGWNDNRDSLVCDARRADATYAEIVENSGLAKGTVNSILTKAGLIGPQASNPTEESMPTPTASSYFPSHPNLIRTTLISGDAFKPGSRYEIEYKPFTGDEPTPEPPSYEDQDAAIEQHPDDEQAIKAEYNQRFAEYETLYTLWRQAYYRKRVTPLITAAFEARPVVDAALRELDEAWTALDTATVWPVAVKRVLDAQTAATEAMRHWTYTYAEPLATVESKYPEEIADWQDVARKLGHDPQFDIGWTYRDNYDSSPLSDLDRKITDQRRRMAEIAQYSKQDDR